jgi:hypothetical protein
MNQQISVDALREMGSFAPEPLRTHGSTLNAPRDLKAGERAEWIVGFAKPRRTPAVYQLSLPDDEQHPVPDCRRSNQSELQKNASSKLLLLYP